MGPPSVSSVLISPKPVFSDEDLVCSYSGYSDPDGDPDESIVEWLLAGVVQATGPNLGRDLNKGEEWTCQVTPSDGWLQGAPVSDTVVVSNSPPSCSSVVISPRPVEAGMTLDCAYGFADVDADMDQSTISWWIDGVYIADGASFSGGFARGQVVTCEVTPWDGESAGAICRSDETVTNHVGQVSQVTIRDPLRRAGETR